MKTELLIISLNKGELDVVQRALDLLHLEIQRRCRSPQGITVTPDDLELLRHWRALVAKLPEWEVPR